MRSVASIEAVWRQSWTYDAQTPRSPPLSGYLEHASTPVKLCGELVG